MKELSYHIQPATGQPMVCRAAKGRCPYGGQSGKENHYKSFDEAQSAADRLLADKFGVIGENDNRVEIEARKALIYDHLADSAIESEEVISSTDVTEMLESVFDRFSRHSSDWSNIRALFKNPHLPRSLIERIVAKPDDYTSAIQMEFVKSPVITYEDLNQFVDNATDEDVIFEAHSSSPLFTEERIMTIMSNEQNAKNPRYNGFGINPNSPMEVKQELLMKGRR